MRLHLVILFCVALAGCNNSAREAEERARIEAENRWHKEEQARIEAENRRAEEARLAAAQKQREQDCIMAAYKRTVAASYTNLMLVGAIDRENLSNCPNDFRQAIFSLREKTQLLEETQQEIRQHADREDDAMGSGLLLTIGEMITNSSFGVTPASDWMDRNTELKDRLNRRYAEAREAISALREVVVRHDLAFGPPESESDGNSATDTGTGNTTGM
jgi:hypothetical protein